MSCSSGKSIEIANGVRGFPSKCVCGSRVGIYISKTSKNPGRPFYACVTKKDDHLFKWVEEAVLEEVEEAVPKQKELESAVTGLNEMIVEMKEEILRNQAEVRKYKKNNTLSLVFVVLIVIVIVIVFHIVSKLRAHQLVLKY